MNYTNINITSDNKRFKYIVEYIPNNEASRSFPSYYINSKNQIFFCSNNLKNIVHKRNYWNIFEDTSLTDYIPDSYKTCIFDVYFPRFSVDTYNSNVSYVLTINTWINSKAVYLASVLLSRNDAIASSTVKTFLNDEYYEHIEIEAIDPTYLQYDDSWKDFRINICGEKSISKELQYNNDASAINISLTAVQNIDGTWVKLDNYDTEYSAINVIDTFNQKLNATLKLELDSSRKFVCKINYNEFYNSLHDYILETYQLDTDLTELKTIFGLTFRDKNDAYKYIEHTYNGLKETDEFQISELSIKNWTDFIEGEYANVIIMLRIDEDDIIVLTSNTILLTQDTFKYLLPVSINKINLDRVDMNIQKYDVVNIVKNEIVTIERPNDYKANLLTPVFIKVQEASTIRLHKSVTENIVINLDAYKNSIDAFTIKIGDYNSNELGRVNSGVVFKINGVSLPEETEGTYYILNDNNELVTNGKYIII
jgi:hypothetical protein